MSTSPETDRETVRAPDVDRILTGDLSGRAQGFLIVPPQGYRLEAATEAALKDAYGTGQHPDIRRLMPEGKGGLIKVEPLRDALPFLAATPAAAAMKTLVIYDAHRLNVSAANALLKPLEEPTASTRILVITDQPAALPATIRSRCAVIVPASNAALARAELTHALRDIPDMLTPGVDAIALAQADGNPGLAAEILRHKLSSWIKSLAKWLGSSDATPPLPVLSGKTAAPLPAVIAALQALMVKAARGTGDGKIAGWSEEAAALAAWTVIESCQDIGRAGIDGRTRLHRVLIEARAAAKAAMTAT